MAQTAIWLDPLMSRYSETGSDAPRTPAFFLMQCLEDFHLVDRIELALRATGYSALRDVEVFVNARSVRLVGCVPTYYLKQVALASVSPLAGTRFVRNDLCVMPSIGRH